MKLTASRISALSVLRAIRSGELADRAFAHAAEQLPVRERPWLHELVYGTLRLRGRLDFILDRFVKRGASALDPDVLDILRLGVYQLLEMDSVPSYAAVSQSVELARSLRHRAATGFVNAVLQSLRRAQNDLAAQPMNSIETLTSWGSHPRWLIERWVARFGILATARLVDANNQRPALYVRAVGIDSDEVIRRAGDIGITLERVETTPAALKVMNGNVHELLAQLPVIVQDPAAGLVIDYAAPTGGVIVDLCAAPGGKAIALADATRAHGNVIASDMSAARLERAQANVQRLSQSPSLPVSLSLKFLVADARNPAIACADTVLLDAPCTGTGTFRRHPDGKWRITPDDLKALVQLQREMLDAAGEIVKLGGFLVYATCSLEPEENTDQVTAFLDRHPNFLRRPPADWPLPATIDEVGNLIVLPQDLGFDGSFAARLERVA